MRHIYLRTSPLIINISIMRLSVITVLFNLLIECMMEMRNCFILKLIQTLHCNSKQICGQHLILIMLEWICWISILAYIERIFKVEKCHSWRWTRVRLRNRIEIVLPDTWHNKSQRCYCFWWRRLLLWYRLLHDMNMRVSLWSLSYLFFHLLIFTGIGIGVPSLPNKLFGIILFLPLFLLNAINFLKIHEEFCGTYWMHLDTPSPQIFLHCLRGK